MSRRKVNALPHLKGQSQFMTSADPLQNGRLVRPEPVNICLTCSVMPCIILMIFLNIFLLILHDLRWCELNWFHMISLYVDDSILIYLKISEYIRTQEFEVLLLSRLSFCVSLSFFLLLFGFLHFRKPPYGFFLNGGWPQTIGLLKRSNFGWFGGSRIERTPPHSNSADTG